MSFLTEGGGVKIGNSVSISYRAVIYSRSHYSWHPEFEGYNKEVVIGNCCWIGTQSLIMPGSILKDRTVIGVNSVFKGTSEEDGIYVGNPAIFQRKRGLSENYDMFVMPFFK